MKPDSTNSVMPDLNGALNLLHDAVTEISIEKTGIINTYGRTLAESIRYDSSLPPFNTAACDGYAAIAADTIGATQNNPHQLGVLSSATSSNKRIQPGTVIQISEGNPLPIGADTVIPIGATYRPSADPQVIILAESKPGVNIRPAGALASQGEIALVKGTVIGPREMSLLAAIGKQGIAISRKPRVAVITAGDSVVEMVEEIAPGQIRNSMRYEIMGMVLEAGCELGRLAHARSGRIELEKAISENLDSDMLIVSLGPDDKHDLAVQALNNLGDVRFARVHLAPGSATAFGTVEGRPVFITAGSTALEAFEALIRPALLTILSRAEIQRSRLMATAHDPMRLSPGYSHYIRALTIFEKGKYLSRSLDCLSARERISARPNSLIIIPPNIDIIKRGDKVEVTMLEHYKR